MRCTSKKPPRSLVSVAPVALAALALLGCQILPGQLPADRLDPRTGVTISTADGVLIFARTEGRYSRSARDYLYLGPTALNRQGLREYFLWVGVATTLDRGYLAPEHEMPATLHIALNGEPMDFDLHSWDEIAPGLSATPNYPTSVELQGQFGARITRDQLKRLEENPSASVQTITADGANKHYLLWSDNVRWSESMALGD